MIQGLQEGALQEMETGLLEKDIKRILRVREKEKEKAGRREEYI